MKRSYIPIEQLADAFCGDSSKENTKKLERFVKHCLTTRQREIFVRYYQEGETLQQIADALGVTESSVCRTKNRAVKRLERYLLVTRG